MESNPRFGAYFYASLADKLSNMAKNKDSQQFESLFTAKVRDAYRGNAIWLQGSDSIILAAQTMKQHKTKSILVSHDNRVGLFTESAFRDIVIAGASTEEPIYKWSPFELISIDVEDYVFNALLRMTQFKIQRVVVTEDGQPIGTLEQIDVLAYFSNHTHLVAQRLDKAQNVEELIDIADQMTHSIQILHSNGVRAPQLAQLMQVLNTSLFEKAWRLIAPEDLYENSCLIVMGSEGRGEQILKTDQDNALILREGVNEAVAKSASEAFSNTLARLGYPPCDGKIMVNNPFWRKSISEFKETIRQWCYAPDGDSLMNLAIFVDAKCVAGDETLLDQAKEQLHRSMTDDAGTLGRFARAIELFDHQNTGFFAQLLNRDSSSQMDIKKMGVFPVVHGIRALSLEAHLSETNTFERIARLTQAGVLDENLSKDLSEALTYLLDIRLKAGLLAHAVCALEGNHNQVDMQSLTTLERDLLKEALQVVKRFKGMIRTHFHLGNF
jgi:CBS domain-containing protein